MSSTFSIPPRAIRSEVYVRLALANKLSREFPGKYAVARKPRIRELYGYAAIPEYIQNELYIPPEGTPPMGLELDFSIMNTENGKTMYGEVKNQKGYVSEETKADGRGNAHERLAKYFTPGLLKALRRAGNISDEHYPFWVVLTGDITRDFRHNQELAYWFDGAEGHYFCWVDTSDPEPLFDHFKKYIMPILD